jgi:hypothetical protein
MSSFGGSFVGMLSGHHGRHPRQYYGRRLGESHYFSDEPRFIQRARSILRGDFQGKDHWSTKVRAGIPPPEMHQVLLGLATRMNSDTPVAARFQSKPARVKDLVDPTSIAGSVSSAGVLYRFHDRPRTFRYPRPLRLNSVQTAAVTAELERLVRVQAIERAPNHDGHKALGVDAATWERQPMPPGEWPREVQVPILNLRQQAKYDQQQSNVQAERQRAGLPFRDFESAIFTVPKGDGGLRLCTDYRALNMFQVKSKFQLDGTKAIGSMIQPGDYGALVDIKDCYLEFGVHPAHRRFCRFRDPRLRRWQWRTMSFGMSEAPHLCTRILRPFMSILKGLGVRCSIYLDDLLVLSQSPSSLAVSMGVAIELLQGELGLQLKLAKCNFTPSRLFTALGVIWDTTSMQCLMPKRRISNIRSSATRILNSAGAGARSGTFDYERSTPVRTRDLARLVGQCVSTSIAIKPAKRRLLFIQQLLGKSVKRKGWEGQIRLTPESVTAIRWWASKEPFLANGNDIVPPTRPIQGWVTSDAATHNAGWGGTLQLGERTWTTRGFFTKDERSLYINNLELLGNRKTVESLLPRAVPRSQWHLVHLQCQLDNVAAIKYGKVGVSRSLGMSMLGADYFDWRETHRLSIGFQFLAGVLNVTSDTLSRWEMTHREWQLHPPLFREVCHLLGLTPVVDLFASRQNRQLSRFFSFEHDYEAEGTNAFNSEWGQLGTVYAYPPPVLIARLLQKLRYDNVRSAIVMVPVWIAQSWWPTMLEMLTSTPLLLPNEEWITQDQWDQPTWGGKWSMIAVPLSGNLGFARESRRRSWNGDGHHLRRDIFRSMTRISNDSGDGGRTLTNLVGSVQTAFELEF